MLWHVVYAAWGGQCCRGVCASGVVCNCFCPAQLTPHGFGPQTQQWRVMLLMTHFKSLALANCLQSNSRNMPDKRIIARPAERPTTTTASPPIPSTPVVGPGTVKAATIRTTPAASSSRHLLSSPHLHPVVNALDRALHHRQLLQPGSDAAKDGAEAAAATAARADPAGASAAAAAQDKGAPGAQVQQGADAQSSSRTDKTTSSVSGAWADARSDNRTATARAAALAAASSSTNSSSAANASAWSNVTNPDGSYSYAWSNSSATSWRSSWNTSWSVAWSEANATTGAPADQGSSQVMMCGGALGHCWGVCSLSCLRVLA